jgi:hypothetical protein
MEIEVCLPPPLLRPQKCKERERRKKNDLFLEFNPAAATRRKRKGVVQTKFDCHFSEEI